MSQASPAPSSADHPVALVTGPTSGIGRAFAQRLAARGYDLVLVARDEARLKELADELTTSYAVTCDVLVADLVDRDQLERVEDRLAEGQPPVDLLVNNAGFGLNRPFLEASADALESQVAVMVTAVLRLTRAAVPGMVARGSGGVLNVASVAGLLNAGPYGAAKAWVLTFSAGLGEELRGTGVTITALVPGFVRTEFHQRAGQDVSGFPDWAWLDADAVAAEGVRAVRSGKHRVVPGTAYKAAALAGKLLPATLVGRGYYSWRKPSRRAGADDGV
jgi:short-subunit dehydrogenase